MIPVEHGIAPRWLTFTVEPDPNCCLCGEALAGARIVHKACADKEFARDAAYGAWLEELK